MQTPSKRVLNSSLVLLAVAALSGVHAQDQARPEVRTPDYPDEARPEVTPTYYAEFQYATITGTTNTINATMVPVVTSTGVVYKNLTLQVNVSATGVITVATGSPTVVASPSVMVSAFKAGTYMGPSTVNGGRNLITVSGPGVVSGGQTVWSLSASTGADSCTYPASASWYVGSPTSTNNPLYTRLANAKITSTAYSYGTGGDSDTSCSVNGSWAGGTLIGVSQTGNQLIISSFSTLGTFDKSSPIDSVTYTLQ
jgi:hypothetical protein